MRILVIGAGLAGPLLAHGLMRSGMEVVLYEREPADELSQGFRLHIAPEGDLALRQCLPSHLYERILATAGKPGSGVRVLDPELNVVHEMLVPPTEDQSETGRHLTVDRQTLRSILLTGVDARCGSAFERYELLDDGRVRAHFASGETDEADLLVGSDGTHSRVRTQLLPNAKVRETGQAEIFGKTPLTDEVRALTPPAALDGFSMIVGADGRAVPLASHEFLSGGEDYVMWVVVAPTERFPADVATMPKEKLTEVAAAAVDDWHPSIGKLIRRARVPSVNPTTIRTAEPVSPWETVPVTLLGDAIHTMVPQGTSAAVALKDAALLSRRLTERTGSLLEAVHEYEAEMLDYGFAEVERSLRSAEANQ